MPYNPGERWRWVAWAGVEVVERVRFGDICHLFGCRVREEVEGGGGAFGISRWQDGFVLTERGTHVGRTGLQQKVRISILDM